MKRKKSKKWILCFAGLWAIGLLMFGKAPKSEAAEKGMPSLTITAEPSAEMKQGIYTGDVWLSLAADCPGSGIKNIRYEVSAGGIVTQQADIYNFYTERPKTAPVIHHYDKRNVILVDKIKNDKPNVWTTVFLTDLSGNTVQRSIHLQMDASGPEISVAYEDFGAVHVSDDLTGVQGKRCAHIYVKERNFVPGKLQVSAVNEAGRAAAIGSWRAADMGNVRLDPVYELIVEFSEDGIWSLTVSGEDEAGLPSNGYQDRFLVDIRDPEIEIKYEDVGETMFPGDRTVQITMTERSPQSIRVWDGEEEISLSWSRSGDKTSGKITICEEGPHQLRVWARDRSGREVVVEKEAFIIDKTAPRIRLKGIKEGMVWTRDKALSFEAEILEDHLKTAEKTLTAINWKNGSLEKTEIPEAGWTSLWEDGCYELSVSAEDEAGNQTEEVCHFVINRKGTVCDADAYTKALAESGDVQQVTEDLHLYLWNTGYLKKVQVLVNGSPLLEGTGYKLQRRKEENDWEACEITVDARIFAAEGEYRVQLFADDAEKHAFDSELSGWELTFRVDRTAPRVTLLGLTDRGHYEEKEHEVLLSAEDPGGRIEKLTVSAAEEELLSITGEELWEKQKETGSISFTLSEGFYESVHILCTDQAGNLYEESFDRIAINVPWFRRLLYLLVKNVI